jgi:hypothetical protein
MRRINEIIDPCLKDKVIEALARKQGLSPAEIPHWYEMTDSEYSDLLRELNEAVDVVEVPGEKDPRE